MLCELDAYFLRVYFMTELFDFSFSYFFLQSPVFFGTLVLRGHSSNFIAG